LILLFLCFYVYILARARQGTDFTGGATQGDITVPEKQTARQRLQLIIIL